VQLIERGSIRFKGAVQVLEGFEPAPALLGEQDSELRRVL
jgi:hypothetical protein